MLKKLFLGDENNLIGKSFAWTAAAGIAYSLQSVIFLAIITNVLGDVKGGIYSIGMMIAQQVLTIGKFSVRNFQVADVRGIYSFEDYCTFRLFSCTAAMLVTLVWTLIEGYSGEVVIVIICMTVYKIAECISDLFEGLYQQRQRTDVSGKSQFVKCVLMMLIFCSVIVITKNLVMASVALAVFSLILIVIIDVPLTKYFDKIGLSFRWNKLWGIFTGCFSIFVGSFIYMYINNTPKYAINKYAGENSEAMLSEFNALFMPAYVVELLAGFTMRVWIGKMAMYHNVKDRKGLGKTIRGQLLVIASVTLIGMVGIYFLGGPVLSLIYGTNLYGYEIANVLLMLAGGMTAVYTLFENVLIIYGKQPSFMIINICAAILAAVLLPYCTIKGGITGAAVGYLLVGTVRALAYYGTAQFFTCKLYK